MSLAPMGDPRSQTHGQDPALTAQVPYEVAER